MKEKAKRTKEIAWKLVEKLWITLSVACVGFLIAWLCLAAIFTWVLSRS